MSYCNVWAEVFCGFPKKGDVETNFTMPIFQTLPPHQVSNVVLFQLVRFASSTRRRRRRRRRRR